MSVKRYSNAYFYTFESTINYIQQLTCIKRITTHFAPNDSQSWLPPIGRQGIDTHQVAPLEEELPKREHRQRTASLECNPRPGPWQAGIAVLYTTNRPMHHNSDYHCPVRNLSRRRHAHAASNPSSEAPPPCPNPNRNQTRSVRWNNSKRAPTPRDSNPPALYLY